MKAGAQMNVLDARVGEIDFAPEKNSHAHMNSFLIEAIPQRAIAEIKITEA